MLGCTAVLCAGAARPWPVLPRAAQAAREGKPDLVPSDLSLLQTPVLPPSALVAPFLLPQPLWSECGTHRTEDEAGQGAVYWLLMSLSGIVLEMS